MGTLLLLQNQETSGYHLNPRLLPRAAYQDLIASFLVGPYLVLLLPRFPRAFLVGRESEWGHPCLKQEEVIWLSMVLAAK